MIEDSRASFHRRPSQAAKPVAAADTNLLWALRGEWDNASAPSPSREVKRDSDFGDLLAGLD